MEKRSLIYHLLDLIWVVSRVGSSSSSGDSLDNFISLHVTKSYRRLWSSRPEILIWTTRHHLHMIQTNPQFPIVERPGGELLYDVVLEGTYKNHNKRQKGKTRKPELALVLLG